MRLFFALWPPRETASALADWARGLAGRATAAEKIHLTLAFLGPVDAATAAAAARQVQGRRHRLPIERAGYWRHNQIVWAGPHETPAELATLVESLQGELRKASFTLEERPYAAHVTLLRKAPRPTAWPALPAVAWPATQFALVESVQGRYRTIEAFQLR
jgi:RNA 2',3'-cyclic 3'-phosphodiesterase